MFPKTAIALTIIVVTATGVLAGTKESSSNPNWDAYECPGAYVGSNPRVLINRPQNGLCDVRE